MYRFLRLNHDVSESQLVIQVKMARTKQSARKSTGGKCPKRGFHARTRRGGPALTLYKPRVPNMFIVPAVDPYLNRGVNRQPEVETNDYEPLDGPDSDESQESIDQPSDSLQLEEESTNNFINAGDGDVVNKEWE